MQAPSVALTNLTDPELDEIIDEVRTDAILRKAQSTLFETMTETMTEFNVTHAHRLEWVTRGWAISMIVAAICLVGVFVLRRPRRIEIVKMIPSADPWGMRSRWAARTMPSKDPAKPGALVHDPPPPPVAATSPMPRSTSAVSTCSSMSYTEEDHSDGRRDLVVDATPFWSTTPKSHVTRPKKKPLEQRPPFRVFMKK